MIENRVLGDWDPKVVEAVGRFAQGDLVERPPFFYAATPSYAVWETTVLLADEVAEGEDVVVELDPEERPPYGVLTTQGCDIADVTRKPWVQVAPVFGATVVAEDRLPNVRRGAVPHLVLLEPPSLAGLWLADLRIEFPIEKSWLADREPISGFSSDEERLEFAQRLAGRLERPDLSDEVHDLIVRPLRRFLDRANANLRRALGNAGVEFRLAVQSEADGQRQCRLLAIGRRGEIPKDLEEALEGWWVGPTTENLSGVNLLGNRYGTSNDFTMHEYVTSVLLDDRFLG
jgi:hypothetical protein